MADDDRANELGGEVQIEAFGVPGTEGRPAGRIRRSYDPRGFSSAMWLPPSAPTVDVHAAFRSDVVVPEDGLFELSVLTCGDFGLWVDGELVVWGPFRFAPSVPEYVTLPLLLTAGTHHLALHVHADHVTTRTWAPTSNFAWVRLCQGERHVPLTWTCRWLAEYRQTGLRVSPLQGWMEWVDQYLEPSWRVAPPFGPEWLPVHAVDLSAQFGDPTAADLPVPPLAYVRPGRVARGTYRETYTGYRWDDPAVQFLLADLDPSASDDADGQWFRFDLGRTRVGALDLTVQASSPAEVTIAYAEKPAPNGRIAPVAALSAGPTRMIQHYAVPAGESRIEPIQALGARYLEVRVRGNGRFSLQDVTFRTRDPLGEPRGSFHCPDQRLNEIWSVGLDTLRSSAEDSLVDPVRERGEWLGDVASAAAEILAAGWGDYALVHRALLHAAAGARQDGLVAGCGPGELLYLGTYAAQWTTACLRLATLQGSTAVLTEFEDSGRENIRALTAHIDPAGTHSLPWPFVDWGYAPETDQPDLAVLCHVIESLRSWARWRRLLHDDAESMELDQLDHRLTRVVAAAVSSSGRPMYHARTLAARLGIVPPAECAERLLRHMTCAFPFDPSAARLRDPTVARDVVTPYFTNYSMPVLLDAGFGERVADLWRRGWGWMLDQGATTWWEVFDDRWSQCHFWSAAPTWQMTRYILGLHPALTADGPLVDIKVNTCGLSTATGTVFVPQVGPVDVEWRATNDQLRFVLNLPESARIVTRNGVQDFDAGTHEFHLRPLGHGDRFGLG